MILEQKNEYNNPPPATSKKKVRKKALFTVADIASFREVDGVKADGLEETVVTWVGRDGRAIIVADRKTKYFSSLGVNGILDLSDAFEGSQLSRFPSETQAMLKQVFLTPIVAVEPIPAVYSDIEHQLESIPADNGRFLKLYLEKLDKRVTNSNTIKRLHVVMLEPFLCDAWIFDETQHRFLSEGDYVVKIWSLLKTFFRDTRTILETISENAKDGSSRV